jgi:hypothetical protein
VLNNRHSLPVWRAKMARNQQRQFRMRVMPKDSRAIALGSLDDTISCV